MTRIIILTCFLLSLITGYAQTYNQVGWDTQILGSVHSFEGKGYSLGLPGVPISFPTTDATAFGCAATGSASCSGITASTMNISTDSSSATNQTILYNNLNSSGILNIDNLANSSLTTWITIYEQYGQEVGARLNGPTVSGSGTIEMDENVCLAATFSDTYCRPSSNTYQGQSTLICGSGHSGCTNPTVGSKYPSSAGDLTAPSIVSYVTTETTGANPNSIHFGSGGLHLNANWQ